MDKKILQTVLVAVVAVCVGVILTTKTVNNDAYRELITVQKQLVDQQNNILALQKDFNLKMDTKIAAPSPSVSSASGGSDPDLQKRVAELERKVDGLLAALKAAQQGGAQGQQPAGDEYTKVHQIPVAHSYVKGKKDAPVTIVEFVDFQCPFCARFHPVVEEVLKEYPEKVNVMIKNFPLNFHQQARPAAKAALAAGEQGKYWEMVNLLMENSRTLTDEKFTELAGSLGLNVEKFNQDYKNKDADWEKIINADFALGQSVDVKGTPTFYINGRKTMSRDINSFKNEINALLK
jgi:protein-disulfide isomerase